MKPASKDRTQITGIRRPATPAAAPPRGEGAVEAGRPAWTFLTNHGHVLLCLAADPELTVEVLARRVGITERSARRIIVDLQEGGYLRKERVGRRNRYALAPERPLRHPVEAHHRVAKLLALAGAG